MKIGTKLTFNRMIFSEELCCAIFVSASIIDRLSCWYGTYNRLIFTLSLLSDNSNCYEAIYCLHSWDCELLNLLMFSAGIDRGRARL